MKYLLLICFFLISSQAEALPLPEFVSAGFGISEFIFLLLGLIGIAFPFIKFKRFKFGTIILAISLVISLYFNIQSFLPPKIVSSDEQEHPFMQWSEEQRQHDPYGLDENQAYKLIQKQNPNYIFIDARTRAETELGTAQGFIPMNWVDLATLHKEDLKNKKVVVTCWTGMRGSEICAKLRQLGIDCQYLKGGLEAWRNLGLPILLKTGVSLSDFGTQQPIANMMTYFSHQQFISLQKEHIPVIDIRSEKYYQQKHILGSINIPFDDLSSSDLQYKIQTLPPSLKGYIVACFGLVSCSEAPSFGWELENFGGKYLGSYAGGFQSFENQVNPSSYQKIISFLSKSFSYFGQLSSNFLIICIIGIFLGINLWLTKFLSFNYFKQRKSIRDKEKQVSLNYDDTVIQRERKHHLKNHFYLTILSISPILFFSIYVLLFESLSLSFGQRWAMTAGYSIFTLISSLFLTSSIAFNLYKQQYSFYNYIIKYAFYLLIFICSFLAISLFTYFHIFIFLFSYFAMLNIDLSPFIFKEILEKLCIYWFQKKGYISLRFAHYINKNTKSGELSYLLNKGVSIPSGFIISPTCQSLPKLLFRTKNKWIVRSTALNEDQQQSSQAGLFLSLINENKKTIGHDIKKVFLSYHSTTLSKEVVLVQELVHAKFAGVMFSQNPQCGGTSLIEWGEGLANKRMEGGENTNTLILNQKTGEVLAEQKPFPYSVELFLLLKKLTHIYQKPIDVEWVIDADDKIWIVQVRPQTHLEFIQLDNFNQMKQSFIDKEFYPLKTNELSILMQSCIPLSASLITGLWKTGGSMDKASCMALWKWKGFIGQQDYYQYFAGKLWCSDYSILEEPNSLSWKIAKKEYISHKNSIEKEATLLLKNLCKYHAIQWDLLNHIDILNIWMELKTTWETLQCFSFYFELMLSLAMKENSEHNIHSDGTEHILKVFYQNKLSFHALQEYELSCPRYLEYEANVSNYHTSEHSINSLEDIPTQFISQLTFYRELYKYYSLETFYLMRKIILHLEQNYSFIYFLTHEELDLLIKDHKKAQDIASQRKIEDIFYSSLSLPQELNLNQVISLGYIKKYNISEDHIDKKHSGQFVSQAEPLHGLVFDINGMNEEVLENKLIEKLEKYQSIILYSTMISPQIVQAIQTFIQKHDGSNMLIALCSLYGSVLSHSSILTREYQIPFIIHLDLSLYNEKFISINAQGKIQS